MDKPSRFSATPEDIDAWLREEFTDDRRLKFYQWIGAMAVRDMIEDLLGTLGQDPTPVEHRHYSPDDVYAFLDYVDPAKEGGPYPVHLPLGRPFCDVQWHTHPHGGGRLPTCRLDSPE